MVGRTRASSDVELPPISARLRNRGRIVEAALALWMDQPDASMDDVAVQAGVVRRTLYSHFGTREELVVAVAERATAFIDEIARQPPSPTEHAASRLAAMAVQLWTFGSQLRLVWSATSTTPPSGLSAARARITAAVGAIVAEGQAAGEFSSHLPPFAMASVLESAAAALHEAAQTDTTVGTHQVALTSLLLVGIDQDRAREIVEGTLT